MTSSKKSTIKKGHRTKTTEPTSPTFRFVAVCLYSVVLSVSVAFLFILIASAIIIKAPDPIAAIKPTALISLYLSALICGFISKKSSSLPSALIGVTSGLSLTLIVMTVSFFLPNSAQASFLPGTKALLFILIFPTAIIGSLLGGIKMSKKRKSPYSKRK